MKGSKNKTPARPSKQSKDTTEKRRSDADTQSIESSHEEDDQDLEGSNEQEMKASDQPKAQRSAANMNLEKLRETREIKRSITECINAHETECLDASNPQQAAYWLLRLHVVAVEAGITDNFAGTRSESVGDTEWDAKETSAMTFLSSKKLVGEVNAMTLNTMRNSGSASAAAMYKHIVASIRGGDLRTPDHIKEMMKEPLLPEGNLGVHTNRFTILNSRFTIANAGTPMASRDSKLIFLYSLLQQPILQTHAKSQIALEKVGKGTEDSLDTIVQKAHTELLDHAKYAREKYAHDPLSDASGQTQEMGLLTRESTSRAASARQSEGKTSRGPLIACPFRNACHYRAHPPNFICQKDPDFQEKMQARANRRGRSDAPTGPTQAGRGRAECRNFKAGRCFRSPCPYAHSAGGGPTNSTKAYSVVTQDSEFDQLRAERAQLEARLANMDAQMARMLSPPATAVQGEYGFASHTRGHSHKPYHTHYTAPGPRSGFDTFGQGRPQE